MKVETLSIVIVGYNSRDTLSLCLPALAHNAVNYEVILVDNNSGDNTEQWVQQSHPQVTFIKNSFNVGYGAACNQGINVSHGDFILVLNPDTIAAPGALDELMRSAHQYPHAFINPALLQPDGTINAYGNTMHFTGLTTCEGLGTEWSNQPPIRHPLLLSGAAILAHRETWQALGGFSSEYFLYLEDTELSLRAQIRGIPIICNTNARIVHNYSLKMSPQKFYYLERNRLMILLTIYQKHTLKKIRRSLVAMEMATYAYAVLKGPRYGWALIKAYAWLWTNRRQLVAKRRHIQNTRNFSDAVILEHTIIELPFNQLVGRRVAHVLQKTVAPLFRNPISKSRMNSL